MIVGSESYAFHDMEGHSFVTRKTGGVPEGNVIKGEV